MTLVSKSNGAFTPQQIVELFVAEINKEQIECNDVDIDEDIQILRDCIADFSNDNFSNLIRENVLLIDE